MPKQSPTFNKLQKKWSTRHAEIKKSLREKHKDVLAWSSTSFPFHKLSAGTLGGLMLITAPVTMATPSAAQTPKAQVVEQYNPNIDKSTFLISDLSNKVPKEVRPLLPEEEDRISSILSSRFNLKVSAELEGIRLNRTYGYIGKEQHLARFPGDNMGIHFDSEDEANKFYSSGMAPGLGAFRYFAPSQNAMTKEDSDREKYYIAVQTFLAPGYFANMKQYNDFFKFRKMLVVNPENGKAVVADIADSGPAVWTGKQLGGSPEVMDYLGRVDGAAKGPVLYFFIDDPNDSVPLGPIQVQ